MNMTTVCMDCRSLLDGSGSRVRKLSDDEYEKLSQERTTSHGLCSECHSERKKEIESLPED